MKLLALASLVLLASCASRLDKKEAMLTHAVSGVKYEEVMIALSKLLDSDEEKVLYDDQKIGRSSVQVIEFCRPEALGRLELVFQVDVKKDSNNVVMNFEGVDTRFRNIFAGTTYNPQATIERSQGAILCNKEEVMAVYESVIKKVESLRSPASK